MSFISIAFVTFLPIVFALYWLLAHVPRWQNALLLFASLFFYGWSDWRCVSLLLVTAVTAYACGMVLDKAPAHRKAVLALGIAINLGILCVFKYYNFFAQNVSAALHALGMHPDFVTLNLVLPVGISFYTFQAIGYITDVYRSSIKPERNIVTFTTFLSFFPQLVAGPIERASHLLPQLHAGRRFNRSHAVDGMRQMLWGYVKKVVVADSCGMIVDQVWNNIDGNGSLQLLIAALLFALQIYCDFSGYSDIAIGCARLFGISLSRNFAYPFFATDMRELWRRWHISLMQWFRDYVYIPLGGNRTGHTAHNQFNLFIVFLLSGLWHGAGWTFALWGIYNAMWVMLTPRNFKIKSQWRPLAMMMTTLIFSIGFIAFRAPDLASLMRYMTHIFACVSGPVYGWHALSYCALALLTEWVMRSRQHGLQLAGHGLMRHRVCRWTLYYLLTLTVIVFFLTARQQTTFIYFRF